MAFEVAPDPVAPEFTTVESYTPTRLTGVQTLQTTLCETRLGWLPVIVASAVDVDANDVFEELHVIQTAALQMASPAGMIGRVIVTQDEVVVGTVLHGVVVDAVPPSGDVPGAPAYWKLTLASGGLASADEASLQTAHINSFGIQVNNPAPSGRRWSLLLRSDIPVQAARMQAMMVGIQASIIGAALAHLSVSKTSDQIVGAAIAMLQDGNSIDSLIASAMEQLEKDRRSGAFSDMTVTGQAPAV